MDRNGQVRKEPTLADLEAFEKLLRDSLQIEPVGAAVPAPAPGAQAPHVSAPHVSAPLAASTADQAAMAELARLIDTPVSFEPPASLNTGLRGAIVAPEPAPAISEERGPDPDALNHTHGSIEAALDQDWQATPTVETRFSAQAAPAESHPAYAAPSTDPLDPLAAFEEELRRFDIARTAELQVHAAAERPEQHDAQPPFEGHPAHAAQSFETGNFAPQYQHGEPDWFAEQAARQPDYAAESQAESSLNAAEERLAAEAAAAAAASSTAIGAGRSKGIFLALGGIAVAGLAVIGGSLMMNSGKTGRSGDVPTIAARPEPTKEKPADPGGVEIPNQNKQVLAARNTQETKPASVVNSTEQPLDLNQVTKRDSVRVITQSPFQNQQPQATPATSDAGAPAPGGPAVEPRRVTSVRIPIGGGDTATIPAGGTAPTPAATAGAVAAGAVARSSTPAPVPPSRPDPAANASAATPTKVETRPVTALPRVETPKVTPPKVETPKVTPPKVATAPTAPTAPKVTPPKATAPLALEGPKASTGGGGFAIQLASRPTEADARSASSQLKSKFAGTLGSRSPSVVSGEANGQTVYRVRVGGYSQADAVAACTKIKAAGGGCFVTKQ